MDHPKVVAAARKSAAAREASFRQELREVDQDLMACRQTLMCAVEALGTAEDDAFEGESGELGVSAINVVRRCVQELVRIGEMVDRLCMKTSAAMSATEKIAGPGELPVDPSKADLAQIEEMARRFFATALRSASEATWDEVLRRGFGSMDAVTLVLLMRRALKEAIATSPFARLSRCKP